MDALSVAMISMLAGLLVALLVLVAAIAFGVSAGNDVLAEIRDMLAGMIDGSGPAYVVPRYQPMRPGDGLALARAHETRLPAVEQSFGKPRPVEVTRDSDPGDETKVSPREHVSGMQPIVDEHGHPLVVPRQAVEVQADESGPGWERQSGTWTREGR